ncbi:hypothetical protein SELMODRAFT_427031 [Selaginella moellendorffii]|uniref:Uncharacterized protein n=1 Tax=Selaginella moellendorffii TaxID=88036 RepID=D8SYA7_SELML|nr:hypothetical protein SELMODRAFT_427031 [Selaginella moellendorffii]
MILCLECIDLAITSLQGVARQFLICKVTLSTFSASWLSIQNGLLVLKENGLLSLKDFVPGLPPISGREFPLHLQEVHAVDPNFTLRDTPQFVPIGQLLPSFAFDGQVGVYELEQERCGFWMEDMSCLDWLDEQPSKSVIYISFGSLGSQASFRGCVSHSLWMEFSFWRRSFVLGVSVIRWPFLYEQPLNCVLAVEHWKIGSRLPPSPDATIVEKAVKDMMGEAGQMWRDNVTKLAISAKDAVADGGLSHRSF